jgi:serine/threonine protein kinase
MGEVYEVFDEVLRERVALKTMGFGAEQDEPSMARFKTELQVARRVTHRNVCRVFDVGEHLIEPTSPNGLAESVPFFTMELLPGDTLRARIRLLGPCATSDLLPLVDQLALGIDAAHQAGIVHSDLKSDNIMLVPEWGGIRVVITDFGLARRMPAPLSRRAGAGTAVAGTIGYMAPEQLQGARATAATDIYALGIVILELLAGELPFSTESLAAAVEQKAWVAPAPTVLQTVTPRCRGVIEKCIAHLAQDRYGSAGEAARALRRAVCARGAASRSWQLLVPLLAALAVVLALAAYARRNTSAAAVPALSTETRLAELGSARASASTNSPLHAPPSSEVEQITSASAPSSLPAPRAAVIATRKPSIRAPAQASAKLPTLPAASAAASQLSVDRQFE